MGRKKNEREESLEVAVCLLEELKKYREDGWISIDTAIPKPGTRELILSFSNAKYVELGVYLEKDNHGDFYIIARDSISDVTFEQVGMNVSAWRYAPYPYKEKADDNV